jgi:hypothetical protein
MAEEQIFLVALSLRALRNETLVHRTWNCSRRWFLKKEDIRFIFNDESTVSCIHVKSNGINVGIGHTCNTMCVYHDTIIKCATLDSFYFLFIVSLPLHNPRSHTCAYVTYMKDNVSRSIANHQAIHNTRISNGQWPRRDVTSSVRLTRSHKNN